MREEHLRGEHEHEPVPRRRRPLQVREVAAGVLEQRPLVDHRQLEVRVGVVDRLAAGLGDDDEREGDRAERERRARPDGRPGGPGDDRRAGRSSPVTSAGDGEREDERRLDEHRDRQVAARAHQREAVRDVPGGGGEREARQREQPGEGERVVADAPVRRPLGRPARAGRRRRGWRRRRPARAGRRRVVPSTVDRALAPQPAQLAVGLQRGRAAAALQPRLPVLDEARAAAARAASRPTICAAPAAAVAALIRAARAARRRAGRARAPIR